MDLTDLRAEVRVTGTIYRPTPSSVAPLCNPAKAREENKSMPPKIKVSI